MPGPSACTKEAEGMGTGITWMRETDRSRDTGRCCLAVITVIPEDYQGIPSQESKARANGHSGFPMPLAPAGRLQLGKQPETEGMRKMAAQESSSPPWLHIRPHPYHTPFYHLKNGANRGRNKLTF